MSAVGQLGTDGLGQAVPGGCALGCGVPRCSHCRWVTDERWGAWERVACPVGPGMEQFHTRLPFSAAWAEGIDLLGWWFSTVRFAPLLGRVRDPRKG